MVASFFYATLKIVLRTFSKVLKPIIFFAF